MRTYYIVIHSAGTPVNVDYTEQQLERDHNARGIQSPMGYHRYIRKSGTTIKGRPFGIKGAHALPYNDDSIGLCYEGGLKAGGKDWRDAEDTRTDQQKAALLEQIHCAVSWIAANKPGYKIVIIGHGQLPDVKKTCPCFDAKTEYEWITT